MESPSLRARRVLASGVHPEVLSNAIAGLRYFRFQIEFRGNNVTNATPAYDSVVMAYTP
jgi:hypothetical protein